MEQKRKIIFMGTSQFAVPILKGLAKAQDVLAVFTQPDRKVGRKQVLTPTPVKEASLELGLDVHQPENINTDEAYELSEKINADIIVVAAYGQILKKKILDLPKEGCLNVHASLLPKYRGASPIQSAIYDRQAETGVSIMQMDQGLDTGGIIKQASLQISKDDYLSLESKLSKLGTEVLLEVLQEAEIKASPQKEELASFSRIIKKEDGLLDFTKHSAAELEAQIRAFSLWPQSFVFWKEKRLKILKADFDNQGHGRKPGEVFEEGGIVKIACQEGSLQILELQLEGKQKMEITSFVRGYPEFLTSFLEVS